MNQTEEFIIKCREMIGTPFKHRGRTKNGVDCAGLVVYVFGQMNKYVYDLKSYGREPHKDGLRQYVQKNLGMPINKPYLPGDIVLMKFNNDPHHIGVLADYNFGGLSLIHSYGEVGQVVEHRLDSIWENRIIEAYRPFQDI